MPTTTAKPQRDEAERGDASTLLNLPPLTLTDVQAAAYLGSISSKTFRRMDASGELGPQCVRFGRATRWPREELEQWVKAGKPRREVWAKLRTQKGR